MPEGALIGTKENTEYLSCVQGIERAMAQGKILEAVAIRCDGSMNLTVDLGCIFGYISKNECTFNNDGDAVKDIAIISRVGKPVCFKVLSLCRDENGQPIHDSMIAMELYHLLDKTGLKVFNSQFRKYKVIN